MNERPAADSTEVGPAPTGSRSYKAFISYSHAVDGKLAPALQRGLHQFAKPWYRLRAVRVFRDEASLSASPALWPSIQSALDASEFFILLASPEAAGSTWVAREVEYWRTHNSLARLLIVLTAGELDWDSEQSDGDQDRMTAMPPGLAEAFTEEPRYIDLRWAKELEDFSLRNARFRDGIADLAAPLHGRPKDELIGEDVRQHRRTVRLARAAAASLAGLTAIAVVLGVLAVLQRDRAISQRDRAISGELATRAIAGLGADPEQSVALALKAVEVTDRPTSQARDALRVALAASHFQAELRAGADGVTSAVFNGDGTRVLTTTEDGATRVWDAAIGRLVAAPGRVPAARPRRSRDARPVLTVVSDRARLSSEVNGRPLAVIPDATSSAANDQVESAYLSPDGRSVLTIGTEPGTTGNAADVDVSVAKLWPAAAGAEPVVVSAEDVDNSVSSASFSPNGKLVVTSSTDRTALVFRVPGGEPVAHLRGHARAVDEATFSPDSTLVLTTSADGTARLWGATTGKQVAILRRDAGPVRSAQFSNDSRLVVTVSGNDATVWRVASAQGGALVNSEDHSVNSVAFSADGTRLVTAGEAGTVVLTPATGGRLTLPSHIGSIEGAAFSRDGKLVITAGGDGVEVWQGGKSRLLPIPGGLVTSMAVSRDGRIVVVGTQRGNTNTLDIRTGTFIGGAKGLDPVRAVGLSQDGRRAVLATSRGLTNIERPTALGTAAVFAGAVASVAFSSGGRLLAAGGDDGGTRVWDLRHRRGAVVLRGHTGVVNSVAFSRDGRLLVTASDDGTARVWDWRRPDEQPVVLLGHVGAIKSAAFSPNGQFVATAGAEGTTRLHSCAPCGSLADLVTRARERGAGSG